MNLGAGVLVHLCGADRWSRARIRGEVRPESFADTGFVHLSTPEQVHLPANRLYRGRGDLLVLYVDPTALESPVRWEQGLPTDPAPMLFPHLYGPLPLRAVIKITTYRPGLDGTFPRLGESD